MPTPSALEICRTDLFTRESELQERYPQVIVDNVLRIREMYNWFIANPDDFCRYYAEHRNKTVVFYYDATALGSNYAVNEQDFRWVIAHEFERHGWQVEAVYIGNPMRHDESSTKSLCSFEKYTIAKNYLLINQGFAGKQRLMPFFNRQNNDDLILAMQAAGVTRGRNGFFLRYFPKALRDNRRTIGGEPSVTMFAKKFETHSLRTLTCCYFEAFLAERPRRFS